MTCFVQTKVAWYPTEAKDRETSVIIVRLYNRANVSEGLFILVVSSQVMKRFAITWVPIRSSVVD